MAFDYCAGLLLFRTQPLWVQRLPRLPIIVPALALAALLAAPEVNIPHFHARGRDLVSVLLLFPLVVALGSQAAGGGETAEILGLASYPLYAIHFPMLVAYTWFAARLDDASWIQNGSNALAASIILALSLGLGIFVDRPLSRWRHRARRIAAGTI